MKISRKNIIDGIGLLALAALFFWFPHQLQQPGIANHKILIATEKLQDGTFDKTVILILRHNGYGAFGLVLNNPPPQQGGADSGGPVEGKVYYTLHSLDVSAPETISLPDLQIGCTKGEKFAKDLGGRREKPEEYIIFKGYAGWGRQQLSREIAAGAWKIIDFNRDLVFHTNPKKMWETAMRMPAAEQKRE